MLSNKILAHLLEQFFKVFKKGSDLRKKEIIIITESIQTERFSDFDCDGLISSLSFRNLRGARVLAMMYKSEAGSLGI